MFDVKVQSEQSSLVSSRYSLRSQARLEYFKFKKIIDLPKIYFNDFDILIVRHEQFFSRPGQLNKMGDVPCTPLRKNSTKIY